MNDDGLGTLPLFHSDDPPASREAAVKKASSAVTDRAAILELLANIGRVGLTAQEIDAVKGWTSGSGSPAGKRLSELIRYPKYGDTGRLCPEPPVVRLRETRRGCHVHVHRKHFDPATMETC